MTDGLIMGLKITYLIDGIKVTKLHQANQRPELQFTLNLAQDEHITFVSFTYTEAGINYLIIKTSGG